MRSRLFAVTVGVAAFAALGAGAIISACYSPPEPVCGFVCDSTGACPADYTCRSDNRCHLNGSPMMSCSVVDASIGPEFIEVFDVPPIADAQIDAELIDAGVDAMPDAMADAMVDAGIDAMDDAAIDAMVDAPPDAMVDAPPDAMIDAMTDAMVDAPDAPPPVDSAPGLDAPDPDAGVPTD